MEQCDDEKLMETARGLMNLGFSDGGLMDLGFSDGGADTDEKEDLETPGETSQFLDEFTDSWTQKDWFWVRESKQTWSVSDQGLFISTCPGSIWSGTELASNFLFRQLPEVNLRFSERFLHLFSFGVDL
jgi:hypothetical protein